MLAITRGNIERMLGITLGTVQTMFKTEKMQCTAWVVFNGTTGFITNSYNISSVVRNNTGDYTLTFTTAMVNVSYAVSIAGLRSLHNTAQDLDFNQQSLASNFAYVSFRVGTGFPSGGVNGYNDSPMVRVVVFGGK